MVQARWLLARVYLCRLPCLEIWHRRMFHDITRHASLPPALRLRVDVNTPCPSAGVEAQHGATTCSPMTCRISGSSSLAGQPALRRGWSAITNARNCRGKRDASHTLASLSPDPVTTRALSADIDAAHMPPCRKKRETTTTRLFFRVKRKGRNPMLNQSTPCFLRRWAVVRGRRRRSTRVTLAARRRRVWMIFLLVLTIVLMGPDDRKSLE